MHGLDGQTLESWKLANLSTNGARALVDVIMKTVFGCEARDVSLLYFLFYLHSGGGALQLTQTSGGAQESRFRGGSQLVAQNAAALLRRAVRFNAPVTRIQDKGPSSSSRRAGGASTPDGSSSRFLPRSVGGSTTTRSSPRSATS